MELHRDVLFGVQSDDQLVTFLKSSNPIPNPLDEIFGSKDCRKMKKYELQSLNSQL